MLTLNLKFMGCVLTLSLLAIARAGQALVDGVTAACYNVLFTSVPILLFAVLDRPVQHFATLIRYPQASSIQVSE